MSERVKWIEREGIKILYFDYSNLDEEEYLKVVEESRQAVLALPPDQRIPTIADTTNSFTTERVKDAQMKMRDELRVYRKAMEEDPAAILGVTGLKKLIAKMLVGNFYYAKDMEDAVRWIVQEVKRLG